MDEIIELPELEAKSGVWEGLVLAICVLTIIMLPRLCCRNNDINYYAYDDKEYKKKWSLFCLSII